MVRNTVNMARRIAGGDDFENRALAKIHDFIKNPERNEETLRGIKLKFRQILQEPIADDSSRWEELLTEMEDYIFDNLPIEKGVDRFLENYLRPDQLYGYIQDYFHQLENSMRAASMKTPRKMVASILKRYATERRIAYAKYRLATDKSLAIKLSDFIRLEIDGLFPGQFKWLWDARKGTTEEGFGSGPGWASFPAKPRDFEENGILGGILFDLSWDAKTITSQEPEANTPEYATWVSGGGSTSLAGIVFDVEIEAGHYFKKEEGGIDDTGGVLLLGTVKVILDAMENPSFVTGQSLAQLQSNLDQLIKESIKNAPSQAKSQAKEWRQKRQRQQQVQQQTQQRQEEFEADALTHGKIDDFVEFVKENNDGVFGTPDFNQLLNHLFRSRQERTDKRGETLQQLKAKGLTFDPEFRELIASAPFELDKIIGQLVTAGFSKQAWELQALALKLT